MIYLDNGATSFPKPESVTRAVERAMLTCANPGRGGHEAAMAGAQAVFSCRNTAAAFFDCAPEQVVFTQNCTQGLNMALNTLIRPGDRVVISGFEHNAVTRTLYRLGARPVVAGRRLFDPEDTLRSFAGAIRRGVRAAVFTHVSNVFGYVLPVRELAALCRRHGVPFVIDAAQSAGTEPVSLGELGADFIAMPGHKGLLGPMGTGLLLCSRLPEPLICGGTGSDSLSQQMPDALPDRGEAGTLNVPGIAGLEAGLETVTALGRETLRHREAELAGQAAAMLQAHGMEVFAGPGQAGTVSFRCALDCEEAAAMLAKRGIALRAGLHCAPLAHKSAGTWRTGTLRLSFGWQNTAADLAQLEEAIQAEPGNP